MLFVGMRGPILFSVCHLATLGGDTGYTKSGQVGQDRIPRLSGTQVARVASGLAGSGPRGFSEAKRTGRGAKRTVQTVLGHASAVVTLRTYAHLWPGDDDRTRSIIDAIFGASADQVRTDGVL